MAQDTSKQTELVEDSLKIWQQLMTMGFDGNIALNAVKRYGTNIQKCVSYILTQNNNAPQKLKPEIKTCDTQTYKDRIDELIAVLRVIELQRDQLQAQDIWGLVEKEYANKNGISAFIQDCAEYAMNIDSIYADNVNKCALEECECIKREFRDRKIYDKNDKKRFKLYSHCENEKSVVIQQLVDQIHINKYHLTDIGLRYIKKNANDNGGYHQ
eukprot:451580_1